MLSWFHCEEEKQNSSAKVPDETEYDRFCINVVLIKLMV